MAAARTLSTAAGVSFFAGAAFSAAAGDFLAATGVAFFAGGAFLGAAGFPERVFHLAIQPRASFTLSGAPDVSAAALAGAGATGASAFFLAGAGFLAAGFAAAFAGAAFFERPLQFAIQARTPDLPFSPFFRCFSSHARRSASRSSRLP